uniref:Uncharacterized protein n=1 Tax=Aegilops tauschii subsp. strangulata TaxID=200361 RepID=A0A453DJV3_AEGTS
MAMVDAEAPFLEGGEEPLAGVSDFRGRPVYHVTSGGWRSAIFVAGMHSLHCISYS